MFPAAGSLLAYGQTGSGKTFTLGEPCNIGGADEGVTTRMLRELYAGIESSKKDFCYTLRAEYLQAYIYIDIDIDIDVSYR